MLPGAAMLLDLEEEEEPDICNQSPRVSSPANPQFLLDIWMCSCVLPRAAHQCGGPDSPRPALVRAPPELEADSPRAVFAGRGVPQYFLESPQGTIPAPRRPQEARQAQQGSQRGAGNWEFCRFAGVCVGPLVVRAWWLLAAQEPLPRQYNRASPNAFVHELSTS